MDYVTSNSNKLQLRFFNTRTEYESQHLSNNAGRNFSARHKLSPACESEQAHRDMPPAPARPMLISSFKGEGPDVRLG